MNEIKLDFLKKLNWHDHDGINLPMINDIVRNQFYDKSLANNVSDCRCIDIGFGTGMLSMLALKHGAKHITAFESDPDRYQFGQLIIEKLNLSDRITLINQRYNNEIFDQISDIDILFTETMSTDLWSEGLFYNLPRKKGIDFLPKNISVKIYACSVSDRFVQTIQHTGSETPRFDPGVDIDPNFINLINELGFLNYTPSESVLNQRIISFNCHEKKEWGWLPHLKVLSVDSQVIAEYTINTKNLSINRRDATGDSINDIDFNAEIQELLINTKEWKDQNVLLVPRVLLNHDNNSLILDDGCWGPIQPIILIKPQDNIIFSHNLLTGNIKFNYEI